MTTAFKESWDIQEAAAKLGFDWPNVEGVLDKLEEEVQEIRESLAENDTDGARNELGDLLLATVNACRFLQIEPATALSQATEKFSHRFETLKNILNQENKSIESCSFDELNLIWERAKHHVG
jgi:uncharacterized protein YabN with tetrapyrrole methylase and pyrophosphatase domain